MFELIAHRYERKSLLITANQPFSQWDKIFPNSMMTVAAIDRLIHHATISRCKQKVSVSKKLPNTQPSLKRLPADP
ncbi:ATP-binding protein (plasmid) [Acaryochloris sp. CCMEE 5410]|nr:ATP-binding protein [Acaryochloris sp. CCMEE 5410]